MKRKTRAQHVEGMEKACGRRNIFLTCKGNKTFKTCRIARSKITIKTIFKWFIPVVCDYNIKCQKISGG